MTAILKYSLFFMGFLSLFFIEKKTQSKIISIGTNPTSKMWIEQYGTASPTIIFINGGGDTIETEWRRILPLLSQNRTVIAYDRFGQGKSSPLSDTKTPRTAKMIISELRELLSKSNAPTPYVLVAHSSGGLYAQYFAQNYPNEVIGLVSINGNLAIEQFPEKIPWLSKNMRDFINKDTIEHKKNLKNKLKYTLKHVHGTPTRKQAEQTAYSLEVMGKKESALQIMSSPPLQKNFHLAVLTSGSFDVETRLQKEFSQTVQNSTFKIFLGTSHYIQSDKPKEVAEIIKSISESVNKKIQERL